jgi:hypothetical protein
MKILLLLTVLIGLTTCHVFGQAHIIKQRAKDLNEQNNARQGIAPPPAAAPARPAPVAPRPMVASPEVVKQHDVARLRTSIASIKPGAEILSSTVDQLSRELTTTARGPVKPSPEPVNKLALNLTTALADVSLPAANQLQLAEDLQAILSGSTLTPQQSQSLITSVQATLQRAGVERKVAVAVVNELKTISGEIRGVSAK